jgi:hypothetical protein
MSRVMLFNRVYPKGHPRQGEPTHFVEKVWESIGYFPTNEIIELLPDEYLNYLRKDSETIYPKHTTIRAGHRWKAGDWFSPRVWGTNINPKTGKSGPYHSNQIAFAPDIQIKKVWSFDVVVGLFFINKDYYAYPWLEYSPKVNTLAENDGLLHDDFLDYFPGEFHGQIITWSEEIKY